MAEYVNLVGAEDVSRAGYTMRDAASTISSAAGSIAHALEMHQRFLDDWLLRFTETMQIASPAGATIRSAQDEEKKEPVYYLTASQVCDRFNISDMSLWRWLNNPELGFPQPLQINRRRYFRRDEIVEWERQHPVKGGNHG